ncbi:molybdate ABC transporter substrate-binding protein [Pseudoduganella sp. FT25W]|jgi:molybdate transport system substrate-binding protein|uniref:Molybdate ABC transporter substrate-binding protein n=1 Tax=Duganella alba TaxID=2666081 RepID=A0A6L5QHA9_9BURK|nr:molybdate ABC transporter substrate-binding protein [Duganella alba]MRX08898.1 molybdate ABC transporter substrate-binding protein [Duganella alba]MRX18808.1 molybdate ABC transporter substrate-binding protein [Duganella alba]
MLKAGVAIILAAFGATASATDITVSAAASLTNAFKEIGAAYEKEHAGDKVQFNFAASDPLVQQISKGAPVDVFASADQDAMDKADNLKLLAPGTRKNFASNSLVLIAPQGGKVPVKALADVTQPAVARITIGNPASVPVGRYTKAALENAKLWTAVEPKLILGTSVRQCLDYVARGEVDAGFVYATDAAIVKDKVTVVATVPTETPVSYPIAVIAAGPQAAAGRKFADYVQSSTGQAILAKYGFGRP